MLHYQLSTERFARRTFRLFSRYTDSADRSITRAHYVICYICSKPTAKSCNTLNSNRTL